MQTPVFSLRLEGQLDLKLADGQTHMVSYPALAGEWTLLSSAGEVNYLAWAGVWTLLSRKVSYPILIGVRTFQRVSVTALLSRLCG
jgi:hypothetical protein